MADDVLLNKVAIIERCIARVREEYAGDERNLFDDVTRQDSIILNVRRACEAAIGLRVEGDVVRIFGYIDTSIIPGVRLSNDRLLLVEN